MNTESFQLNVGDVPIMKLLQALARGGFGIRSDAAGQLHIVSTGSDEVPTLTSPLTARDPLPGRMKAIADAS